jgi:hypothetical protein
MRMAVCVLLISVCIQTKICHHQFLRPSKVSFLTWRFYGRKDTYMQTHMHTLTLLTLHISICISCIQRHMHAHTHSDPPDLADFKQHLMAMENDRMSRQAMQQTVAHLSSQVMTYDTHMCIYTYTYSYGEWSYEQASDATDSRASVDAGKNLWYSCVCVCMCVYIYIYTYSCGEWSYEQASDATDSRASVDAGKNLWYSFVCVCIYVCVYIYICIYI